MQLVNDSFWELFRSASILLMVVLLHLWSWEKEGIQRLNKKMQLRKLLDDIAVLSVFTVDSFSFSLIQDII